MLLLFETAAGFALFKVLKENKIQETEVRRLHGRLDCPQLEEPWLMELVLNRRIYGRILRHWRERRR